MGAWEVLWPRCWVSTAPCPCPLVAIDDVYSPSGEAEELLKMRGLTPERIADAAKSVVTRRKSL